MTNKLIDVTDRRKACDDCSNFGERLAVVETVIEAHDEKMDKTIAAVDRVGNILATQLGFQKGALWVIGGMVAVAEVIPGMVAFLKPLFHP